MFPLGFVHVPYLDLHSHRWFQCVQLPVNITLTTSHLIRGPTSSSLQYNDCDINSDGPNEEKANKTGNRADNKSGDSCMITMS